MELPRFSGQVQTRVLGNTQVLRFTHHGRVVIQGRITSVRVVPPLDELEQLVVC